MLGTLRSAVVAALAALTVTAPSSAQQYGTAEEILSFAEALLRANYADIASDVVANALKRGMPDQNGALTVASAEIKANEAHRMPDGAAKDAKFKEAFTAYEDYLKKFGKSASASEARLKLAGWLCIAGESVAPQIKKETSADKKEALLNDGLNYFTKAEVLSKQRVDELKSIPFEERTETQSNELQGLEFTVARIPFLKAMLYDNREGVEAGSLLTDAERLLEDFDLEYGGTPTGFEARRIMALIAIERKDLETAEEIISFSCDQLADAITAQPELLGDQAVVDLMARFYLEKAEFLTQTKKPVDWKGARDTVTLLRKLAPMSVQTRDGKRAFMILAKALQDEGSMERARDVAQLVFDNDPTGEAGARAREMLDKLTGVGFDIAGLQKVLAGAVERKDIGQAERLVKQILTSKEAAEKPEEKAEALLQMGGLYYNAGHFLYGAVVFACIADEFPKSPKASEAKFNEAMAYARLAATEGRTAQNHWRAKSRRARQELIAQFPTSKEAADVSWFAAEDAKAERKNAEAIDLYLKVPATSPNYAQAQYEAAVLAHDLAYSARLRNQNEEAANRLKQAQGALRACITAVEAAAKQSFSEREIQRAKDIGFAARTRLAMIYTAKEVNKPDEALKLLDEIEAAYKDDKQKIGRVWSLRIRTLNQLGRAQEAISILNANKDVATADTFVAVGREVDSDAFEKMQANDKDPEIDELLKVAGDLYMQAVDKATPSVAAALDLGKVGQRLLSIGARLSKLPDDYSLMEIDPNVPPKQKAFLDAGRRAIEMAPAPGSLDVQRQRAIAFAAAAAGRWIDAVSALKEVSDKYPLFNAQNRLNAESIAAEPRLPDIYQDQAVATLRGARSDPALLRGAADTFTRIAYNSEPTSKRYWEARYLHLLTLKAIGDATRGGEAAYAELTATLASLERTAPDADGNKYGIKDKIDELRKQMGSVITK